MKLTPRLGGNTDEMSSDDSKEERKTGKNSIKDTTTFYSARSVENLIIPSSYDPSKRVSTTHSLNRVSE